MRILTEDDVKELLLCRSNFDKFKLEYITAIQEDENLDMFSKLKLIEDRRLFGFTDELNYSFSDKMISYRKMMSLGYDSLIKASDFYTTMLDTNEERKLFFDEVCTIKKCFFIMKR